MRRSEWIRGLPDDKLAYLFYALLARQRLNILSSLKARGVIKDFEIVDLPMMTQAGIMAWLREQVREVGEP